MCSPAIKVVSKEKRQYAAVTRGIVRQWDEWEESGVPQTDVSLSEYQKVTTGTYQPVVFAALQNIKQNSSL